MPINAIGSGNCVIGGQVKAATILYSTDSGKIIEIYSELLTSVQDPKLRKYDVKVYEDVSPQVILPGLVDAHVHLNEPGRTEWEGFATGTQAAASGGVTTVVDMPLNAIPPTTTVANLNTKVKAARGQLWCDVAFWGGLVPGNLDDLIPLAKAGVRGFKGFLMDSGVQEFPPVDKEYIENAMKALADSKALMMFHAELDKKPGEPKDPNADPREYNSFLASRPDRYEFDAISLVINCLKRLVEENSGKVPSVHIVHLASMEALPLMRQAHADGLPITAETCFHYLTLCAEKIGRGATFCKCCPPVRSETNRVALWKGLREGSITSVVSDHSPCTPELKHLRDGNFFSAWGGISSVGLGLPLLNTIGAAMDPPISFPEVVKWCCENTAKQVGLQDRKGYLRVGYDADFLIFDPKAKQRILNPKVYFKNKLTAYDGQKLSGVVQRTFLRGQVIFDISNGLSEKPFGTTILDPRNY
ncbi:probable Allantoinase [Zygosaccharomyces bailii]|nr:probable Allantoinase [Zygosaccharomyces bailii]